MPARETGKTIGPHCVRPTIFGCATTNSVLKSDREKLKNLGVIAKSLNHITIRTYGMDGALIELDEF